MDKLIANLLVFAESQDFLILIKNLCCHLGSPCDEEIEKDTLTNAMTLSLDLLSSEEYDPEILLIEQISGVIIYGGKRGMPVNDVRRMVVLFLDILKKIKNCENVPTPETIVKYLEKSLRSNAAVSITDHGLLPTATFLLDVLVKNIHLYSYLMIDDWEVESHRDHLSLYLVSDVPPLSSGCLTEEWERRQKLSEREDSFAKEKLELNSIHQELLRKETKCVEQIYDGFLQQMSNEEIHCDSVQGAISNATKSHTDYVAKELLLKVKDNEMDLEFEIDKIEILSPRKKQ